MRLDVAPCVRHDELDSAAGKTPILAAPSVRETKQKLNPVHPWREAGTVQHKNVCRVAHGLIGIKRSAFVVICRGFRIEGI